jgi:hypothetical protein
MPFITQNNASHIIRKLEDSQLDAAYMASLGNPWFRKLYDLSPREQRRLLLHKGFYYNPAPLVQYIKSDRKDTYTYLYEIGRPSYHVDHTCPKLTSSFHSPKIPNKLYDLERGLKAQPPGHYSTRTTKRKKKLF